MTFFVAALRKASHGATRVDEVAPHRESAYSAHWLPLSVSRFFVTMLLCSFDFRSRLDYKEDFVVETPRSGAAFMVPRASWCSSQAQAHNIVFFCRIPELHEHLHVSLRAEY